VSEEVLDTFESGTVIEGTQEAPAADSTGGSVESFDDNEVIEAKSQERGSKENTDKDSQLNTMDDAKEEKEEAKEDKDKEEEEKDEKLDSKGDKDSDDEGRADDDPQDKPKDEEDVPKVKMLKAKINGENQEINPQAEIMVKVDGKREKVSVQELLSNYSGKKKWDQEFTKLSEEKQTFNKENTQYKQELDWLQGNIKEVVGILDDVERNPIDALMHLVDVTNRNPVQFQQKLFKHMQSEVETMSELDEVEQELYWERQKNTYLSKRQESTSAKAKSDTEARDLKAKIDTMREAQGVDESQFMEAHSELEELGFDNVSPEQAINYAIIKPHLDEAESLVKPFEDEMTTDGADKLISDFAKYLKSGEFTKEELKALLVEEYASSSEVQDLKDKVKDFKHNASGPTSKIADRGEGHTESFDDFDNNPSHRTFNF